MDVSVRTNGSAAPHVLLEPSQKIQPVPYAIHALKAGELAGSLPGAQLSGNYPNVVNFSSAANSFAGSGAGLTGLNASQLSSGTVVPLSRVGGGSEVLVPSCTRQLYFRMKQVPIGPN